MPSWKAVLSHLAADSEEYFDRLKYGLHERLGYKHPLMIVPYRGYGTPELVYLKGRVLEDKGIAAAGDNDSVWENLVNMYKRFESDEIPGARVLARFQNVEEEAQANEEGFFEVWIRPAQPLPAGKLWHPLELELLAPQLEGQPPVRATGDILIPPPEAHFGVISDIDDTVLQTDATHLLHMARTVFLGNARTRLPFKGVAAFYRALLHGGEDESALGEQGRQAGTGPGASTARGVQYGETNPLFYVSSSPWNLYDLLSDFFHIQNIPLGPILFLRDWGFSEGEELSIGHRAYKLKAIRRVMEVYPKLPFILIGDSGQEDPEIYAEVVSLYPQRILAIYIRNVSRDLERPAAIRQLAKKVTEAGSTLILADDTLPMAKHAAAQGWISPAALPEIEAEKQADAAPPSPVEKLLGEEDVQAETPTVVVDTGNERAAKKAIDAGAIEEALDTGEKKSPTPPTVVVGDDQDSPG